MQEQVNHQISTKETEQPWYREFWAWFVLAPLIVVVIACSITVSIAVFNADDRVIDNYYKEGRLINTRLEEDLTAARLDLSANIIIDQELGELVVRLQKSDSQFPDKLFLEMSHPAVQGLDQTITLQHIARGQYQAELDKAFQYRWYLRLRPEMMSTLLDAQAAESANNSETNDIAEQSNDVWRLRGEVDFSQHRSRQPLSVLLTPDT